MEGPDVGWAAAGVARSAVAVADASAAVPPAAAGAGREAGATGSPCPVRPDGGCATGGRVDPIGDRAACVRERSGGRVPGGSRLGGSSRPKNFGANRRYPAASARITAAVSAIAPSAIHLSHAVVVVLGVIDGSGVIWTSCPQADGTRATTTMQTAQAPAKSNLSRRRGRTGPDSSNALSGPRLNGRSARDR